MRIGWTITHEGKQYREGDMTVAQAAFIVEQVGGAWAELHPLTSPAHFVAILASFLVRDGIPEDEALAKVGVLPMVDCIESIAAGESDGDLH